MSDFELFGGFESGEGMDPASFEKFKEQMKKNAAFFAALKRDEKRQRQSEAQLITLLMRFLQSHAQTDLLVLAALLIEQNIPALYIVNILSLGNEEIRGELQKAQLTLPEGPSAGHDEAKVAPANPQALVHFGEDVALPLRVKAALNEWAKDLWESASAYPFRLLETSLTEAGEVKDVLITSTAAILRRYLLNEGIDEERLHELNNFAAFLQKSTLKRLRDQIENQQQVETTQKAEWE